MDSSFSSTKMRTKLSVRNKTCFKKSSFSSAAKKKHTDLSSREKTIFRKTNELSILCDVEVCVLYYGRDGKLIKTCPDDQSKVRNMAERFHKLSDNKKFKKSINLSQFLNKKIHDDMKRSLDNNDNTFLQKLLDFEDSLQSNIRKFQNKIEPVQIQSLAVSSSSLCSTDDMSSSVLINNPLMMNLSSSIIDDQSRAASSGFTSTHLSPTLIGDPCQQEWTEPLPDHLNGVYSDSFATGSLNGRQGKFSIFLYNHDNGSFSQLPDFVSSFDQAFLYNHDNGSFSQLSDFVSSFDQATTPLNVGYLGHKEWCSNNNDLPTVIPPHQMQTQDPLLHFDQFVASNQF